MEDHDESIAFGGIVVYSLKSAFVKTSIFIKTSTFAKATEDRSMDRMADRY